MSDTALGAVCLRAVQKEPELRYATAGEFRQALLEIERVDLLDTAEMLPAEQPWLATHDDSKTLQFISVSPDEIQSLVAAAPLPRAASAVQVDAAANTTRNVLIGVAALLAFLIIVVIGVGQSLQVASPPAVEFVPEHGVQTVNAPAEPRAEGGAAPVPAVPAVSAEIDAQADMGEVADAPATLVDLGREERAPSKRREEPKSRPRVRARPVTTAVPEKPEPAPEAPAEPLLLSP